MKINLFFIFIFFVQYPLLKANETKIEVHGYLSRGYIKSSKYNYLAENSIDGTSKWGELGINFAIQAHDRLRIGLQVLARELGTAGKYDPRVDWAFLDYQLTNWASIKYGKFFISGGLYNEGRDVDLLRNSILLPQNVYSERFRDMALMKGLELHGTAEISKNNSIQYSLNKGRSSFEKDSGFISDFSALLPLPSFTANMKNIISSELIWNTWIQGLRLAISHTKVDVDVNSPFLPPILFKNTKALKVVSLEYTKKQWRYTFERFTGHIDLIGLGPTISLFHIKNNYHQITYRLNEHYELGFIHAQSYTDEKGKTNIDQYIKDNSFTISNNLSDNWLLKLEYHKVNGIAGLRPLLNPSGQINAISNKGKNWDIIMAKITYSF
ncbi:MAG: hypothetical protein COB02_01615 [Candidatus Cloacimonadota bacterium]|nr:MAG: hypothetical protein COB02_01615 [Candidatus Cloacimonadota bacterium]